MHCRSIVVSAVLVVLPLAVPVAAEDAAAFYEENCAGCHSIGAGADVGPDLAGVTARRPREWLVRFLLDPPGVVASGDAVAAALVKQWDGAVMDPTPGLTPALAEALLDLVDARSASLSQARTPSEFVSTPDDVARGRGLFAGSARLVNGGAPCAICHAAGLASAAGTLGPDLTAVSTRLRGPRAVSSWLGSPPTPLMRALYRNHPLDAGEARSLAAFFADSHGAPAHSRARQRAMLGLGAFTGVVAGFAFVGAVWRRRFRAVRRPMVEAVHTTSGGRDR
jgi:cytochrome c2